MYDLIYTENYKDYKEIEGIIKKEYPKAKIEDGSDQIHENRFSVEFEIEQEDWFRYIIGKGFALLSLNFQIVARSEPDKIEKIVEEMKK